MNQSTDILQEENDLVPPESLEWRANQIVQALDIKNDVFNEDLLVFRNRFPLNDDEIRAALPFVINKILEWESKEVDAIGDFFAFSWKIYFLTEVYDTPVLMNPSIYALDDETKKIVLWGVVCFYLLECGLKNENLEYNENLERTINKLRDWLDFDKNLLGQSLMIILWESYWHTKLAGPSYWIDQITQLEDGYKKDILLSTPFLWVEKEFLKYTQPAQIKNHVRIGDRQYKVDNKFRKYMEKSPKYSQTPEFNNWCIHLARNQHGKVEFHLVPSMESREGQPLGIAGAFYANQDSNFSATSKVSLWNWNDLMINKDREIRSFFSKLTLLPNPIIDNKVIAKTLEDMRLFDTQKSLSDKAQPIVENVSQDVATLTHRTFINPRQHHTDVAQSLWLDIIDHSDDIWAAEAVGSNHLRYKNQNGESSLHYLPKIAWLIDILEDIIPKNEHGKITAYTLPSSPYIFIYTNTGTIFISDIDNVSTQVFAQKVDAEFINSDFSFPKLWELFWPLTSIKNNFEEIISDEEAESWAENIVDALNKKDGYFLELISEDKNHWLPNLRAMYVSWEITKKDFATPVWFEQFLENYNRQLLIRNDISPKEKQARSFTNSRWNVPITQRFITALGGHKFFTWFHGYSGLFCDYLDALLSDNEKQKNDLYEKLRSENRVRRSTKNWIDELKNSTRTISEIQFHQLFSSDVRTKRWIRKELDIPQGLFSSISWIIALGYDPEGYTDWETPEAYLYRILVQENIIRRTTWL